MTSTDLAAKPAMPATSTPPPVLCITHFFLGTSINRDSLIQYTKATKDYMVPAVWGPVEKKDDPYAPTKQGGCCVVM